MADTKLFTTGEGEIGRNANNEQYYSPGNVKRIVPIDEYEIDPAITHRATRYHFIKVPLLGQSNPKAYAYGGQGDWCGRTAATMVFNYYLLIGGEVGGPDDYITMYDPSPDGAGSDVPWEMDLRKKNESIAFKGYSLASNLEEAFGRGFTEKWRLFDSFARSAGNGRTLVQRVGDAQEEVASDAGVDRAFVDVVDTLKANNPIIFYSGFSVSRTFNSHIICICGFCYLPEKSGDKLWILVADPGGTPRGSKLTTMFKPLRDKNGKIAKRAEDDAKLLDQLEEGKNDIIRLRPGSWVYGRAGLYLVRARKLFERKQTRDDLPCLWMDYTYYDGSPNSGGLYRHLEKPTPYHREVIQSSLFDQTTFPLQRDANRLESPMHHYFANENAGRGGHYPVGLQRAVHGGMHLAPSVEAATPVKCCAPGYVVATRLSFAEPAPGKDDAEAKANKLRFDRQLAFFRGPIGFVLVRHDLEVGAEGERQDATLYSLYLHMTPAQARMDQAPNAGLSWLRRLYEARYGSVVNLDPLSGDLGELYWADEPVADKMGEGGSDRCKVQVESGEPNKTLRKDGRYLAYVREPPADFAAAYQALVEKRAAVTFSQPILRLGRGDVLGHVKATLGGDGDPLPRGSLHWEILCPKGDESAIQRLVDAYSYLCDDLGVEAPELVEGKETKADNFLERNEFKSMLAERLPDEEPREPFKDYLEDPVVARGEDSAGKTHVATALNGFYRDPKTYFGLQPEDETEEKPEAKDFTYPVRIKINNPYGIDSEARFTVRVYTGDGLAQEIDLEEPVASRTLNAGKIGETRELVVRVPVDTEQIEVVSKDFHLERHQASASDAVRKRRARDLELFNAAIKYRWRNIHLKHLNEWTTKGLDALLDRFDEVTKKTKRKAPKMAEQKDDFGAAMWWDGPEMVKGGKEPIFDQMLPPSAEIENLNPVTALWLLKLLETNERLRYKSPGEPEEETNEPLYWSWVLDDPSRARVLGQSTAVVAIGKKYVSGSVALAAQESTSGEKVELTAGEYNDDGVLASSVQVNTWGRLKLLANGSDAPAEQGGLSSPSLEVAKPELAGAQVNLQYEPEAGEVSFTVGFGGGCPAFATAAVHYDCAKVPAPGAKNESLRAAVYWHNWTWDAKGERIVGVASGASMLTKNFSFVELSKVLAKDASGIAPNVCLAAQAVRGSPHFGGGLDPTSISADGCTVVLRPSTAVGRRNVGKIAGSEEKKQEIFALITDFVPSDSSIEYVSQAPGASVDSIKITTTPPSPAKWKRSPIMTLASGASLRQTTYKMDESGFIIDAKVQKDRNEVLTRGCDLTLQHYRSAKGWSKLHPYLHLQVQALQAAISAELGKSIAVSVTSLEEGVQASVTCTAWAANAKALRDEANELGTFSEVELEMQGKTPRGLRLKIDPKSRRLSGWNTFTFDATATFFDLSRKSDVGPAEVLLVKGAVVIPQRWSGVEDDALHINGTTVDTEDENAGVEYAGETLELASPAVFVTLAKVGFGAAQIEMDGWRVQVSVALLGAEDDWKRAGLTLVVTNGKTTRSFRGTVSNGVFVASFDPHGRGLAGNELDIQLQTTGRTRFYHQQVEHEPLKIASGYDATPRLAKGSFRADVYEDVICFEAQAEAFPTSRILQIHCYRHTKGSDLPYERARDLEGHIEYAEPYSGAAAGFCEPDGSFVAELAGEHLSRGLEYEFVLRRPIVKAPWRPSLDQVVDEKSSVLKLGKRSFTIEPQQVSLTDYPKSATD